MLTEAYKAEYETTPITLTDLMAKYELTKEDLPGHETWTSFITKQAMPTKKPRLTKKQAKVDKVLATIVEEPIPRQDLITSPEEPTETQLDKIAQFKELALDHCINFMNKDAKFSEVKEFKDIVAIVDTLEKSYQKVDPDAGKPTINILINNLMERFNDDC